MRGAFEDWIAGFCSKGVLNDSAARQIEKDDPTFLPGARLTCREAESGEDLDDVFYTRLADTKCVYVERGGFDDNQASHFFERYFGWMTKLDEVAAEWTEGQQSLCNDFRNGRMTGRDALFKEAALWREFQRKSSSTAWQELWEKLTWPFKVLLWLLVPLGTVVAIIVGLKTIHGGK